MPENDPLVRLHKVVPVVMYLTGSRATVVEHQHPRRDPFGIKTIANRVTAQGRDENIGRVKRFAAMERQRCVGAGSCDSQQQPKNCSEHFLHPSVLNKLPVVGAKPSFHD
jgi:hypothetical protein